MADEARLVVELVDRSGAGGQASPGASAPGASNVPGSDLAQQTQDRITQQGAGASLGSGSVAYTPKTGDPLIPAVSQIVGQDPRVTPAELAASLGIPSGQAEALLQAAKQLAGTLGPAQPGASPAPAIAPPAGSSLGGQSQAPSRIPYVDPDPLMGMGGRPASKPVDPYLVPAGNPARTVTGSVDDPYFGMGGKAVETNKSVASGYEVPGGRPVVTPSTGVDDPSFGMDPSSRIIDAEAVQEEANQQQQLPTQRNVQQAVNLIAGIASQGGPIGIAVGNVAQSVAMIPGAVGGMVASVAPAVPYIGAAIAAVGVPAAAYAAGTNEMRRARTLIGDFSPEVSAAEARAEIRQVQANIQTSRALGDEVARYIDAQSRLNVSTQRIRDIVSEPLLQDFNNVVSALSRIAENTAQVSEENKESVQGLTRFFSDTFLFTLSPNLALLVKQLRQANERAENIDSNPLRFFLKETPLPAWPAPFDTGAGKSMNTDLIDFDAVPGLSL